MTDSRIYWNRFATPFQIREVASLSEDACASGVYGGYVFELKNIEGKVITLRKVWINGAQKTFCQKHGEGDYDLSAQTFDPGKQK